MSRELEEGAAGGPAIDPELAKLATAIANITAANVEAMHMPVSRRMEIVTCCKRLAVSAYEIGWNAAIEQAAAATGLRADVLVGLHPMPDPGVAESSFSLDFDAVGRSIAAGLAEYFASRARVRSVQAAKSGTGGEAGGAT